MRPRWPSQTERAPQASGAQAGEPRVVSPYSPSPSRALPLHLALSLSISDLDLSLLLDLDLRYFPTPFATPLGSPLGTPLSKELRVISTKLPHNSRAFRESSEFPQHALSSVFGACCGVIAELIADIEHVCIAHDEGSGGCWPRLEFL